MPYGMEYLGYGGSSLPAMQVNPVMAGITASNAMNEGQLQQSALISQQQAQQKESVLAPLAIQKAQQQSALDTADYNQKSLANIAQQTEQMDGTEADKAAYWDTQLKKQAEGGNDLAGQYVGNYNEDLPGRVAGTYGLGAGQKGTATATAPNPQMLAAFGQMTPQARQQVLAKQNAVIEGFNRVKTEQDFNNELQVARQQGIPVDSFINPSAPWTTNYAMIHNRIVNTLAPQRDALASIVASEATGMPLPAAPNKLQEVGGRLYSINPAGTAATPLTSPANKYTYESSTTTGGAPQVFNPETGAVSDVSGAGGLGGVGMAPGQSPFAGFAQQMMKAENSTGNPGAQNPLSSATGNGQFIDSTWLGMLNTVNPAIAKGLSTQQKLALRTDPAFATEMTEQYAQQNAVKLSQEGLPVTTASLALAHRFGAQGASEVLQTLQTKPDTPLSQIFPAKVIQANPGLANVTTGQYMQGLVNTFGNTTLGDANSVLTNPNGEPRSSNSKSILAQAGLSYPAFLAITGQLSKLSRDKATRNQALKEATDFANKNGVDVSTFGSQYQAYNTVLQQNVQRMNSTKIMENEILGTLQNLEPVANASSMGQFKAENLAKLWAGKQVNDPMVMQYSFQLGQLRSELAGYNAALQGRTGSAITDADNKEAEQIIMNGLSSKAAGGLQTAVQAATGKMGRVMQNSVSAANRAVWDLFGLGKQFDKAYNPAASGPGAAGAAPQGGQGNPAGNAPQGAGAPVHVQTPQEAMKLPRGTLFITPSGQMKVR